MKVSAERVAGPTPDPAVALLRGGAAPALIACLALAAGFLIAGRNAMASATFGGLLAIAALAAGPLLLRIGRGYSPVGLMALALCGYGAVVFALAIAFMLVRGAGWLSGFPAAVGVLGCAATWLAGQARTTSRLRVLTYGEASARGEGPPS